MNEIPFNVEINRILDLLCSQIYDSPLSLLRENVQNAYDAILQRQHIDHTFTNPEIKITIDQHLLVIKDNGIGMDDDGLIKHYWTAGSSGKNNDEARAAGVVGTFGVGAMANFGVCTELNVRTRLYGSDITFVSGVQKNNLSLSKNCIYIEKASEGLSDYGTEIAVNISKDFLFTADNAIAYLLPYVKFLKVPVYLNGELLSMKAYGIQQAPVTRVCDLRRFDNNDLCFDYQVAFNNAAAVQPQCVMSNIKYKGSDVKGDVCLKYGDDSLYGLRNSFGLAPIAANSVFQLGGIVNLLNLVPTAGREAVSRESSSFVTKLVSIADDIIAEEIAKYPVANNSRELHLYIRNNRRYDLSDYIEIPIGGPTDRSVPLKLVQPIFEGKKAYYYKGSNREKINSLLDANIVLFTFSNDYNRAHIQQKVMQLRHIEERKEEIRVSNICDDKDLTVEELSIIVRTRMVIEEDYSLANFRLAYADISNDVSVTTKVDNDVLCIYFDRKSPEFDYLKEVCRDKFALFDKFIKDMVRTRLYPKFAQYLPSATKEGADALFAYLQRKIEHITLENADMGDMNDMMDDYLSGKRKMEDIINAARNNKQKQKQVVNPNSVGHVDDALGEPPVQNTRQKQTTRSNEVDPFMPMPPLLRLEKKIDYKVLRSEDRSNSLNNIKMFLCLSDKMFRDYAEFFYQPHTTNVIWSMHRIIYFFTHASNNLTLYYQMDLEKPIAMDAKGAISIPTTTIITKNKIFIPIPDDMYDYFNIKEGQIKFMVKYDSVQNNEKK